MDNITSIVDRIPPPNKKPWADFYAILNKSREVTRGMNLPSHVIATADGLAVITKHEKTS